MKKITEKGFQATIVAYAKLKGWRTYHTLRSKGSTSGFPDLTLVRARRLVFAEVKTDVGILSVEQLVWQRDLAATGPEVYVWRPSDWPDIERILS